MPVTRFTVAACALAMLLAGCATTPPEEDPVQIRLGDIDGRLGRVERVVNNQSLIDLGRRLDALEAEVRSLRGATEELQNGSEGVRKQQRDLYADLDRRLTQLEQSLRGAGGAPPGGAGPAVAVGGAAAATADQDAYGRAFETLKGGDYAAAIAQLRDFMQAYPKSGLLDNAQYWLGEAYYVTHDYEHAAAAFRAVGERWPDSRKAPDALLKLGYTLQEQKRLPEARTTLRQVGQRFPGSDAAKLAAERLQKLGADTH